MKKVSITNGKVKMGGNPVDDLLINCQKDPSDMAIQLLVDEIENRGEIVLNSHVLMDGRAFIVKRYDIDRAMAIIQEENLEKTAVDCYINGKIAERPMMLVFCAADDGNQNSQLDECKKWMWKKYKYSSISGHPLKQGHEHFINDGKVEKIADHPELLNEVFLPPSLTDDTQVVIYHRYTEQFEASHLRYVVDFANKTKIPTVCLMNKYEMDHCLDWNKENFDVIYIF